MEILPSSESDWEKKLTQEQYTILRKKGTEMAFTGKYHNHKGTGVYTCAGCGATLFSSDKKFDSGTGWPSFFDAADPTVVGQRMDTSHGMVRTEVYCKKCGGHLGHVFDDGPTPTGKRFCINSACLAFEEKK